MSKKLMDYLPKVEALEIGLIFTNRFSYTSEIEGDQDEIVLDIFDSLTGVQFTLLEVENAEYVPETGEWLIGGNDTTEPYSLTIYTLNTLGNDDE